MVFQKAKEQELERVIHFYYEVIEGMENNPFNSGWKKDIYPAKEFLKREILKQNLYISLENERIIAAVILNHEYHDSYNKIKWENDFKPQEVLYVHTLAVLPSMHGKGLAKEVCEFVLKQAKKQQMKAVRLEVLERNLIAKKLYTGLGFVCKGGVLMYYEDTGEDTYLVYECIL